MKIKLSQIVFLLTACTFFIGCERRMNPKNRFVYDFLLENGRLLYKSEMKRTKLDYLPASKELVYSFWKKKVFQDNGTLFLHLYLEDSLSLPENRKKYGFLNIGIGEGDIQNVDSTHFYIVKDLSVYGNVNRVVTGQYVGTKRTWEVDEKINSNNLNSALKLNGRNKSKVENSGSDFMESFISDNSIIHYVDGTTKINCFIGLNKKRLYLSNVTPRFLEDDFEFRFYEIDGDIENVLERKSLNKIRKYCPLEMPCFASAVLPKSVDRISFVSLENMESTELFSIRLE